MTVTYTHTQLQRCPLLMQVFLYCGQWGLKNDSMTEWVPFYEEHFESSGRVHTYLETGWSSFLSGLSDLKTSCAKTNFDSQFAIDDSGLRVPWI
jgi:hypothetical protein